VEGRTISFVSNRNFEELWYWTGSLARLDAQAGDVEAARNNLERAREWKESYMANLPPAEATGERTRFVSAHIENLVLEALHDWTGVERLARAEFAIVAEGGQRDPQNRRLQFYRARAGHALGLALLRTGRAREAEPVLAEAVKDFQGTTDVYDAGEVWSHGALRRDAPDTWAEALIAIGELPAARRKLEEQLAAREAVVAASPEFWRAQAGLSHTAYLLASVTSDVARRNSLLDRAAKILCAPDADQKLSVDDRELLKQIEAMQHDGHGVRKEGVGAGTRLKITPAAAGKFSGVEKR
jgi:tetratricopeptide (TPR) repeat protein